MLKIRAGQRFGAGVGLSTAVPGGDYETYSEAGYVWDEDALKWGSLPGLSNQDRGLKAVGAHNYIRHPSFEVLSLSYDLLVGTDVTLWVPPFDLRHIDDRRHGLADQHHPWDLLHHVEDGEPLEAWNAMFEYLVWNLYCVPKWGWPRLKIEQMHCAMAKSRVSAYPGELDEAGRLLKLVNQKDPIGKTLIRKLTVPKNPTKKDGALRWTPFTATEDFQKFYAYNKQDVRAELEASLKLPDLSPHERQVWLADFRINLRGMQINLKSVDDCISIIEQAFLKYNSRLQAITNGFVKSASEVQKILQWCELQGVTLNGLDEEALIEFFKLEMRSIPANVVEVIRIRQTLAYGSVKKLYKMRAQATPEGRIHDQYVYHGAHTSLWNGRSVQPANLYSGKLHKPDEVREALGVIATRSLEAVEAIYGDALEVVADCLRSMICAKPGHDLISSDYSAIQAVVLAAMFGEEWRLEVFRTHGKIYEMTVADLTGISVYDVISHKKRTGEHHPYRQQYGKIPELSAGFGAWIDGWKQFGADKFFTDAEIKSLILKWRAKSPMIVEGWGGQTRYKFTDYEREELYGLEGAAIKAVKYPGECYAYRGIAYQMHEDVLYCRPPSGGYIRYHAPRLDVSSKNYARPWELDMSYEGWNTNATKGRPGWQRMSLYGGILTQNADSHMCREIQAGAIIRLEDAGYPVVMHTHDEDVAEVLKGWGSVEEMEQLMTPTEEWARTPDGRPWPVAPKGGWRCDFYGKWEM